MNAEDKLMWRLAIFAGAILLGVSIVAIWAARALP